MAKNDISKVPVEMEVDRVKSELHGIPNKNENKTKYKDLSNVDNVDNVEVVDYSVDKIDKIDKIDSRQGVVTVVPRILKKGVFERILAILYPENIKNYNELAVEMKVDYKTVAKTLERKEVYFDVSSKDGKRICLKLSNAGKQYVEDAAEMYLKSINFKAKSLRDEETRLKKGGELTFEADKILREIKPEIRDTSTYLDFEKILVESPAFADRLLDDPDEVIGAMKGSSWSGDGDIIILNLPKIVSYCIEDLRSEHIDKLIMIEGRCVSLSTVRPIIKVAKYECPNCGSVLTINQYDQRLQAPRRCSCGWRGNFKLLSKTLVDSANVMMEDLQERTENPNLQRVKAKIESRLTRNGNIGIFTPGNQIRLVGILREVPNYIRGERSVELGIHFEIHHAELFEPEIDTDNLSDEIREEIKMLASRIDQDGLGEVNKSFAPDVYGYEQQKNAIILQLCNSRNNPQKGGIRNKPNILLIGDPGIAKSVLGKFAVSVTPGARKAVGGGSSSVGLTASVVKEDDSIGGYRVEPGALVLAKELLFLDELNNLNDDDKPKLQEGLSEQCYDYLTEILTDKGWKFFGDLDKTEKVATLTRDGRLKFNKPNKWIKYNYDGKMIHFASNKCDLLVTPKHKMFVSRKVRKDNLKINDFKLMEAEDIKDKCFRFKRDAIWEGDEVSEFVIPPIRKFKNQNCNGNMTRKIVFKMEDWLEFLGYYISEGSLSYTKKIPYNIFLTQSEEVNPKTLKKMKSCLTRLGLKWKQSGKNVYFCSKQIATYLSQLKTVKEKFVPNFVKKLSNRQIKIIIGSLLDGDGHRGKTCTSYVTSSKRLADDVQELLLRIGISGTISIRTKEKLNSYKCVLRGRRIKFTGDMYTINFGNYNMPYLNHHKKWKQSKEVDYRGDVYCVDVSNHIVYVRRNGKPCWSGNSVTINKANLHVNLKVTAGVLATANPKEGSFDPNMDYVPQFNIPLPIINRFDEIFVMKDEPNDQRDRAIANKMLERERDKINPEHDRDFLRKFFVYVRTRPEPEIDDDISEKLNDLYAKERRFKTRNLVINPRFIETLTRLIKASAKLRLSKKVEDKDIERALKILNASHYNTREYSQFKQKTEDKKVDQLFEDLKKAKGL